MTVYECPHCGTVVESAATAGGAFNLPPRITCYHCGDGDPTPMEHINEQRIRGEL